jgi:hypothetical protein
LEEEDDKLVEEVSGSTRTINPCPRDMGTKKQLFEPDYISSKVFE